MVERYKSGFTMPGDIPFEDLTNGKTGSQNNLNHNPDRGPGFKGGTSTIGRKREKKGGLFDLFSNRSKVCGLASSVL